MHTDTTVKPSVTAFDAIINGSLSQFVAASDKIGGDVHTQVTGFIVIVEYIFVRFGDYH